MYTMNYDTVRSTLITVLQSLEGNHQVDSSTLDSIYDFVCGIIDGDMYTTATIEGITMASLSLYPGYRVDWNSVIVAWETAGVPIPDIGFPIVQLTKTINGRVKRFILRVQFMPSVEIYGEKEDQLWVVL